MTTEALKAALERVTTNYRLTLAGKPVRDVSETLAECDAALAKAEQPDSDTAALRLVCDLRFALGDNGTRMQPELIEYAKQLKAKADAADAKAEQPEQAQPGGA